MTTVRWLQTKSQSKRHNNTETTIQGIHKILNKHGYPISQGHVANLLRVGEIDIATVLAKLNNTKLNLTIWLNRDNSQELDDAFGLLLDEAYAELLNDK